MVGNETTQLQYTGKGHRSLDDILEMTKEYEEEERRQREEQQQQQESNEEDEENQDL